MYWLLTIEYQLHSRGPTKSHAVWKGRLVDYVIHQTREYRHEAPTVVAAWPISEEEYNTLHEETGY